MKELHGHCLCGAVNITINAHESVSACHCSICRRWCGGPMLAVHAEGAPEIQGEEAISNYRSSDFAERAFCRHCGSNLFYHLLPGPFSANGEYILAAGILDLEHASLDSEIFIDAQPNWYRFHESSSRKRLTEQEFLKSLGIPT